MGDKHAAAASTCGARSAPPLSILIAHEQHLQQMGCDTRLLGIVKGMRSGGHTVSLLFRHSTPVELRSPPSADVAQLLGIRGFREEDLRADAATRPPPPLMAEYAGGAQLARLFARGQFNAVLVFFWFWLDPKPNIAEIMLPYVHAFAPRQRRPYVAVLSDDAHALRDARLAQWETYPPLRAAYAGRAAGHLARQRRAYLLADMLLYITRADAEAERAVLPFSRKLGLLRIALGGADGTPSPDATDADATDADAADATDLAALEAADGDAAERWRRFDPSVQRIGFLGNGDTPTNHLAVQWFLRECWPALRARLPRLRLRLVGRPPGKKGGGGGGGCDPAVVVHCGWAWGTPLAGNEAAGGVDELGFVPDDEMEAELSSWRAMVVPVLQTTGVNTKVYAALQRGVPLVITPVAAAPLEFPPNSSAALLAADATAFVGGVESLVTNASAWQLRSTAGRQHWGRLVRWARGERDLDRLLHTLCAELGHARFLRTAHVAPRALAWAATSSSSSSSSIDTPSAVPLPPPSAAATKVAGADAAARALCFPPNATAAAAAPAASLEADAPPPLPIVVGFHVATTGGDAAGAERAATRLWEAVCETCAMRCALLGRTHAAHVAKHGAAAAEDDDDDDGDEDGEPTAHRAPLLVPTGTELALVALGRSEVIDIDGISLAATETSVRAAVGSRWLHMVVDLDGRLDAPPDLAAAASSDATAPPPSRVEAAPSAQQSAELAMPGLVATQLMVQARSQGAAGAARAMLLPAVTSACHNKTAMRMALRFIGVADAALQPIFSKLGALAPASCRHERGGGGHERRGGGGGGGGGDAAVSGAQDGAREARRAGAGGRGDALHARAGR